MKLRHFRILSNLIIFIMLVSLVGFLTSSNYNYVFSYNNENVIYKGNQDTRNISLMFNVYWGTEYIDDILEILDKYNIKCTFFIGGQWAEKETEILKKIHSKGHEIANHGYLHKEHKNLDYKQNYDEININHQFIKTNLGIDMKLFAPPSGSFNKSTITACQNLGYSVIMWSKDTIDWRDKDSNLIYNRATKNIESGDFILAHPTKHTLKALPLILEYYKLNNWNPTTVSNCLK